MSARAWDRSLFDAVCRAETPAKVFELADARSASHRLVDSPLLAGALPSADTEVVLFGAGRWGTRAARSLRARGWRIAFHADSNAAMHGGTIDGVGIIAPEQIGTHCRNPLVLIAAMQTDGIERRLQAMDLDYLFVERDGNLGCLPANNLLRSRGDVDEVYRRLDDGQSQRTYVEVLKARLFQDVSFGLAGNLFTSQIASSPQYFLPDLDWRDEERYVDCGAYDGDSIVAFHRFRITRGEAPPVALGFEADAGNCARARATLAHYGLADCRVVHACVGARSERVQARDLHNCNTAAADDEVETVRLDDALANFEPSYIKMDIEGFEAEALEGARGIVRQVEPKLAICIYHDTEDLYRLPLIASEMQPGFRFAIRHHHAQTLWETVLYARP